MDSYDKVVTINISQVTLRIPLMLITTHGTQSRAGIQWEDRWLGALLTARCRRTLFSLLLTCDTLPG